MSDGQRHDLYTCSCQTVLLLLLHVIALSKREEISGIDSHQPTPSTEVKDTYYSRVSETGKEDKTDIRKKWSTTKPDEIMDELNSSARNLLARMQAKSCASKPDEVTQEPRRKKETCSIMARLKARRLASELEKENGGEAEDCRNKEGKADTGTETRDAGHNMSGQLNPDGETRQKGELNRLPSPFLAADGTVTSASISVLSLRSLADHKDNTSTNTERGGSLAVDSQRAQAPSQAHSETSTPRAVNPSSQLSYQTQSHACNEDNSPLITFLRSALDASTRELEQKAKWYYLQEQDIARREEEVERKERELDEWIGRLSELAGVMKERERNAAKKEEMARIMLAGYGKTLTACDADAPTQSQAAKREAEPVDKIVVRFPPTVDRIDSSKQQHNGDTVHIDRSHNDSTEDAYFNPIGDQAIISAENTPSAMRDERPTQAEPEYSAEEFQQFLSQFEASPVKKQETGARFPEMIIDTDQLIDLAGSLEVSSDLWQVNDHYGEDLRRAALAKERGHSVALADGPKSDVQRGQDLDLGIGTSKTSAAKMDGKAALDRRPDGKTSNPRTLTKQEQAVLSSTVQSLNSRIGTMFQQQNTGIRKHLPEEAKAYQYSIEYLEKLRHKYKAAISAGLGLTLQENNLEVQGTKPDIYWYFRLSPWGLPGIFTSQLVKMLYLPHDRKAQGSQSDYNRRRTLLVSGRHDYADMVAEKLADMGTGRQVALIHDDRGSQANKNAATAFRSGSRNILVCTMNWAGQFLTENVCQLLLYRFRAPDQSGAQAKKELKALLTEIEGIKKDNKLVRSMRVKILFGSEESAFKTVVEKVLRVSQATCVDKLEMLESFFPRANDVL